MKQEASRQIQEGEKRQFATLLLPSQVVGNPVLSAQVISLLGGHWGNIALQTEVAISASALLIFAGNTAIIGSYHVFLALSRMEFFPEFVQQRNKLRGTPHFSILLAIAIPICVLVAVQGAITVLGGSVTLLGMGIAYFTYARKKQQGHVPVPITHVEEHLPGSMLAVLMPDTTHNEAVIRSAIQNAQGKPVTFLYLGHATTYQATRLFEYHDPYYDDQQARSTFGNA